MTTPARPPRWTSATIHLAITGDWDVHLREQILTAVERAVCPDWGTPGHACRMMTASVHTDTYPDAQAQDPEVTGDWAVSEPCG